jgi:hypothetical protein
MRRGPREGPGGELKAVRHFIHRPVIKEQDKANIEFWRGGAFDRDGTFGFGDGVAVAD